MIESYENYILNSNNMLSYLKYKLLNQNDTQNDVKKTKQNSLANKSLSETIFYPKEHDSLFWCYYIIAFGETNYETINHRNVLVSKQIKIDYCINKIRSNKTIVKMHKFDTITNIENNLANDYNINIKTVMTLCSIDKINLIFLSKNTYYELLMNDTEPIYVIYENENNSKHLKKYGFQIANSNLLEEIRTTMYKIDTLGKPLKSLSSYKVQCLIDICDKLKIQTKNHITGKNKTKNELYELLIQYF